MTQTTSKISNTGTVPLLMVLVVLLLFGVIEAAHPYFFFQDDNRGQNLPYYVHNLRALAAGEFPFFNFHQFLGTATFSCMQPATFYPVNYGALLLSKLLFGHVYASIDIIAFTHLQLAALGLYSFLRYLGINAPGSFFAGLTWAFCGFVVSVGNSWIFITGIAAWLPWILLFATRQIFKVNPRDFAVLALLRLMLLFVGHPQFFAYCVLFDFLTVLLLYWSFRKQGENYRGRHLLPATTCCLNWLAGYFCVFIAALPLLLPVMHQVTISKARSHVISFEDYIDFSYDFGQWWNGLLTPFFEPDKVYYCNQHYISHIGYLSPVFIVVALFLLRRGENRRQILAVAGLALFSLFWACDIVVARLIYLVPFFNRFANPFKLGFFTSFYLIIIAAYGVHCGYEYLRSRWAGRRIVVTVTVVLLALHLGGLLLYHTVSPQKMFSRHFDPVPLDEPLKDVLASGRVASLGLDEHQFDGYVVYGNSVPTLGFNYATLFGLYHIGGYEVLVANKNANAALGLNYYSLFYARPGTEINLQRDMELDYLRKWGVRWYSIDKKIPVSTSGNIRLFSSDQWRNVYEDLAARPFVFWNDTLDDRQVRFNFTTNAVSLDSRRLTDGELVVNVLYNPFFVATVDGKTAVITESADGQMLLRVPAGRHTATIVYRDPYFYLGLYISAAVALAGALTYGFRSGWRWRRQQA